MKDVEEQYGVDAAGRQSKSALHDVAFVANDVP